MEVAWLSCAFFRKLCYHTENVVYFPLVKPYPITKLICSSRRRRAYYGSSLTFVWGVFSAQTCRFLPKTEAFFYENSVFCFGTSCCFRDMFLRCFRASVCARAFTGRCESAYWKNVHLWNGQSGALLRTFTGHVGYISSIVFSPDGRTLTSGSSGGTALFWEIAP